MPAPCCRQAGNVAALDSGCSGEGPTIPPPEVFPEGRWEGIRAPRSRRPRAGACAGGSSVGPRDSLRDGPEVLHHNPRVWLRAGVRPLPSAGLLPRGGGELAERLHFRPVPAAGRGGRDVGDGRPCDRSQKPPTDSASLDPVGVWDSRTHQSWDLRRQDPARPQDPGHCGLGPSGSRVSLADDEATGCAGLPQRCCPLRGLCCRWPAGRGVQGSSHQHLVALPALVTCPLPVPDTLRPDPGMWKPCSGPLWTASHHSSSSSLEKSLVRGVLPFCTQLLPPVK